MSGDQETIGRQNTEPRAPQVSNPDLTKAVVGMGEKIVVAIHGIGDQYRNATVQSVVNIFSRCFEQAVAVPLGSFYSPDGKVEPFQFEAPPELRPSMGDIGFVEIYWADIPRRVQRRGYTIEETKAWARTIVARVRSRCGEGLKSSLKLRPEDYLSAAAVIEEMIDAIAVLGNLCFLAEKAGLFRFDFDKLLTSYAGDVQIVADFANYRARILKHFGEILEAVQEGNKKAEIYIVAHSEGTVVAFMGLLQALCDRPPSGGRPPWIDNVRGFMTFGSPIDKHLILWPEMWDPVETPDDLWKLKTPIRWRNYYDFGDPVGFRLDTARDWLADHGWNDFFEFEGADKDGHDKHDFGFARYYLPGKAHNDYWNDPCVFGHFIYDVMGLDPVVNDKPLGPPHQPGAIKPTIPAAPPNRPVARISSVFVPFLIMAILLFVAVYIPFTAINAFAKISEPWNLVFRDVAGIGFLLAGMTFASRVRCLTRSFWYRIAAATGFTLGGFGYVALRTNWIIPWQNVIPSGQDRPDPFLATRNTVITALVLAFAAIVFSILADRNKPFLKKYPQVRIFARGARPLLIAGGIAAAILVWQRVTGANLLPQTLDSSAKSFWPVIVSVAAFIYLWWLAICLFDLTFTWHRYIRRAVWQEYLRQARPGRITTEKAWRAEDGTKSKP
jgi:hypothetical protein